MIVKSLSRSSGTKNGGGTGQLLAYVFRYVLEKEQKEAKEEDKTPVFSEADIPLLIEAFNEGNLNFDALPDPEIAVQKGIADRELDTAIRLAKNTPIGKEFIKREKVHGTDLKKTTLHLTAHHLIARNKDGERFFKLSHSAFSKDKQGIKDKEKETPFIIRHNIRARSVKGYIREFQKLESLRLHPRSNQVEVYHHIVSFSSLDKENITDAILKDIAAKFIELRGIDNLYVGTKHTDRDHIHLHIAMSAIDLAGRSARISKGQFQEIKQCLTQYQMERYGQELSHSLPEHGKKSKRIHKEVIEKNIKTQRTTDKVTLLKVLETTYTKSTSTEHFLSQLKDQGYSAYYRVGELTGVTIDGQQRKFRLARLGYTTDKLHSLDLAKEQEEKQFSELRSLRERTTSRDKTSERLASLNEKQEIELENDQTEEPQSTHEPDTTKDSDDDRSKEEDQQEKDLDSNEQNRDDRDGDSRER